MQIYLHRHSAYTWGPDYSWILLWNGPDCVLPVFCFFFPGCCIEMHNFIFLFVAKECPIKRNSYKHREKKNQKFNNLVNNIFLLVSSETVRGVHNAAPPPGWHYRPAPMLVSP